MVSLQQSAGVLLYRTFDGELEVLIAHPGGPFWARRDAGAWTIPKGLVEEGEAPIETARREFIEEVGLDPGPDLLPLGTIRQRSGKTVHAWAARGDFDPAELDSNLIEIVFPPGSGRLIRFPEVDRVMWASRLVAQEKLNPAQVEFFSRLSDHLQLGS